MGRGPRRNLVWFHRPWCPECATDGGWRGWRAALAGWLASLTPRVFASLTLRLCGFAHAPCVRFAHAPSVRFAHAPCVRFAHAPCARCAHAPCVRMLARAGLGPPRSTSHPARNRTGSKPSSTSHVAGLQCYPCSRSIPPNLQSTIHNPPTTNLSSEGKSSPTPCRGRRRSPSADSSPRR